MNRGPGLVSSVWARVSRRSLHYKERAKNYPQVNAADVELEKPRYGFRRVRQPLLSQSVTDTLFPAEAIKAKYKESDKPVPSKFRSRSDDIARRNHEKLQEEVAEGLPHFKVGEKKVYLPKARVCLLRPNAKHTPYQAKFLVPRNFNKMDLRDYLWHVYGLRALNVTVQLLHASFRRSPDDHARYRGPQFKKMTIDMEEPFVWPELPQEIVDSAEKEFDDQGKTIEHKNAFGSDKHKPTEAFGGLYNKPILPNSYIPSKARKAGEKTVKLQTEAAETKGDRNLVTQYLGL